MKKDEDGNNSERRNDGGRPPFSCNLVPHPNCHLSLVTIVISTEGRDLKPPHHSDLPLRIDGDNLIFFLSPLFVEALWDKSVSSKGLRLFARHIPVRPI